MHMNVCTVCTFIVSHFFFLQYAELKDVWLKDGGVLIGALYCSTLFEALRKREHTGKGVIKKTRPIRDQGVR